MKSSIPDKYLNTNVRAMVSGGLPEPEPNPEPDVEEIPDPPRKPILHLDTVISFFKKSFRLEIKFTREDTQEKEHDGSN